MTQRTNAPGGVQLQRRTIWSAKPRLTARESIAAAAERLGGVDGLVKWVEKDPANERVFWEKIYTRLMATEVKEEVGRKFARALTWLPPTPSPLAAQSPPPALPPPPASSPPTPTPSPMTSPSTPTTSPSSQSR
jgi:hypothetical protein